MALFRKYTNVEKRLLTEWYKETHWAKPHWRRHRVGRLPDTPNPQYYDVLRRWADLIILDGDTILIVEAKIRPKADAIGQLELYALLFNETPEFEPHWNKTKQLIVLTTRNDRVVRQLAESKGMIYEIFRPAWVDVYERDRLKITTRSI